MLAFAGGQVSAAGALLPRLLAALSPAGAATMHVACLSCGHHHKWQPAALAHNPDLACCTLRQQESRCVLQGSSVWWPPGVAALKCFQASTQRLPALIGRLPHVAGRQGRSCNPVLRHRLTAASQGDPPGRVPTVLVLRGLQACQPDARSRHSSI